MSGGRGEKGAVPARPRELSRARGLGSRVAGRGAAVAAVAVASGMLVALAGAAMAQQDPRIARGRQFAEANCALCHQIGRFGDSPLAIAPPFRTLHERYPVEELEEALAEGVVTGHPTMPQVQLDAAQIADFIAYLKSLEK